MCAFMPDHIQPVEPAPLQRHQGNRGEAKVALLVSEKDRYRSKGTHDAERLNKDPRGDRPMSEIGGTRHGRLPSEHAVDEGFGFLLDLCEVVGAFEGFCVDLVDVLGA